MKVKNATVVLVFFSFLVSGCAGMQIEIPRSTVQKKVEKKFPIRKKALVAKTELTNPEVYFEGEKVGIRIKFEGSAVGKKVKGTADVRGDLVYRRKKKKFYVKNMKLVEMKVGKKKITDSIVIRGVINNLVIKKFDGMVVYTLNDSKRKERFAASYMEKVEVDEKNDCLVITLGQRK